MDINCHLKCDRTICYNSLPNLDPVEHEFTCIDLYLAFAIIEAERLDSLVRDTPSSPPHELLLLVFILLFQNRNDKAPFTIFTQHLTTLSKLIFRRLFQHYDYSSSIPQNFSHLHDMAR